MTCLGEVGGGLEDDEGVGGDDRRRDGGEVVRVVGGRGGARGAVARGFLDHGLQMLRITRPAPYGHVDAEQVHDRFTQGFCTQMLRPERRCGGFRVANRRRLPWRGDPPPYNGSTAGFAAAAARPSPAPPPATEKVSAYGVWVSEIMCQQTRVEGGHPVLAGMDGGVSDRARARRCL